MKSPLLKKNTGFSLIELLVALCLSVILVSAAYGLFVSQNSVYINQNRTAEMQQNVRMAMNLLAGEFRMAGFGLSMSGDFSRPGGTTYAISPTNSTSGPDSVTIRYGMTPTPNTTVTLTSAMANSNTGIPLIVSSTTGFVVNDYIIISDGQNAARLQITGINSGTATLQYTSVAPNIFPTGGFAAGSCVYKLREVTYRVFNKVLQIQTDGVSWQDAVNTIEDLQLAYQGTTTPTGTWLDNPSPVNQTTITNVQINLIAVPSDIDSNFSGQRPALRDHPAGSSDHYRRRLLTSTIMIRNLSS
jgi:type IV pilus assembly protein PilW